MTTDFQDAHHRHLKDADTLYNAQRWANADHLYGLSAECGLKALMVCFMLPSSGNNNLQNSDKKHIPSLLPRYESYRFGHHLGSNYLLPATNFFTDWDVSQRYANQGNFTQPIVAPHKQGAESVNTLIKQAQRDGLIQA